jgi:hypothetical protein
MALKRLDTGFVLVVPDFDHSVIGARDQVGLVASVAEVQAVDSLVVALECEIGRRRAKLPHLQRPVQRRRGKSVVVLWVENHLHHVVGVTLENLQHSISATSLNNTIIPIHTC